MPAGIATEEDGEAAVRAAAKAAGFREAALPLIKWLAENVHPHHTAIVTNMNAELLEGQCATGAIVDYIKG